ncbi:hypothetical protein [Micromonospora arborensis]|uniref:hypothetical protein n=1 Tax=Micromonospora arborensis TaxID=2116518 RepID=UPI00371C9F39
MEPDSRNSSLGEQVLAFVSVHSTEVVHLTQWQAALIERLFADIQHGAREAGLAVRLLADEARRTNSRLRFVALAQHWPNTETEVVDGPPNDPMARALSLRRNRNTGPKPTHRAPKSISPRGAR